MLVGEGHWTKEAGEEVVHWMTMGLEAGQSSKGVQEGCWLEERDPGKVWGLAHPTRGPQLGCWKPWVMGPPG